MNVVKAALYAIKNWKLIQESQTAGCYSCLKIIPVSEIKRTTDKGQTAICPLCDCDTLIPDSLTELNNEYLKEVREYWIG